MSFIEAGLVHFSSRQSAQERRLQTSLREGDSSTFEGYQALLKAAKSFDSLLPKTLSSGTTKEAVKQRGTVIEPSTKSHSAMSSLIQSVVAQDEHQQQEPLPELKQQKTVDMQSSAHDVSDTKSTSKLSIPEPSVAMPLRSKTASRQLGLMGTHPSVASSEETPQVPSDVPSIPSFCFNPSFTDSLDSTDSLKSRALGDTTRAETTSTTTLIDQRAKADVTKAKHEHRRKAVGRTDSPSPAVIDSKAELSSDAIKWVGKESAGELTLRGAAVQGAQVTTETTAAAVQRLISQLNGHLSSQSLQQLSLSQQPLHQLRISLPTPLAGGSSGEVLLQIQGRDLKINFRGASEEARRLILPQLSELRTRPGLKDFQLQVSWSTMGIAASLADTSQTRAMGQADNATNQPFDHGRGRKTLYDQEEDDD